MRAIIQRVSDASIEVEKSTVASIEKGLLILLGVEEADSEKDADWLAAKISKMRIFDDESGVMNLSVSDLNYEILVVSQFTLHASTKKGNRPSYIKAARPDQAKPLYEYFTQKISDISGCKTQHGVFGADMQIRFTNNGPVTIFLDSLHPE